MRNEWMEIFSQEGYRFCKVKPEETGAVSYTHLDVYKRQHIYCRTEKKCYSPRQSLLH